MALWQSRYLTWRYDFQVRGRRYQGSFPKVTKTVAKQMYARLRGQAIEGAIAKISNPVFATYAQTWLEHYVATRRPGSARAAAAHVKLFVAEWGQRRISSITRDDILRFQVAQVGRGRKPSTVNRYLAVLSRLFTDAGVVNPVRGVTRQHPRNARTRFLTAEEEARLLLAAKPRPRAVIIAGLHTGCRSHELTSLTWGDVDLDRGVVTIHPQQAKSGRVREIPLSDTLRRLLTELQPHPMDPRQPVFLSQWNAPYRDLTKVFRQVADRAGPYDVTLHDLRHSFASKLVMAGVHLRVVQELLGHASITQTMRDAHLEPSSKTEAVKKLDPLNFSLNCPS